MRVIPVAALLALVACESRGGQVADGGGAARADARVHGAVDAAAARSDAETPDAGTPTADAATPDGAAADAGAPDAAAADAAAADAAPPLPPVTGDCDIRWTPARHDTFDPAYRSPPGAVPSGTVVHLELRTGSEDATGVTLEVYDARARAVRRLPMIRARTTVNAYDWWTYDLDTGPTPTVLYYSFDLEDDGARGACPGGRVPDRDSYVDDDPRFHGGGTGAMSDDPDPGRRFQITVFDPRFSVPDWLKKGVVYQIFPDRFRNGDPANDRPEGEWSYGRLPSVRRSGRAAWNSRVCDPLSVRQPFCPGIRTQNYYGGDLAGITEKLRAGYFDGLGVTVLYLNPIFRSGSNHKYDTIDYAAIDPDMGTAQEFDALAAEASRRGIRLILDGVMNHVSADSRYFDRFSRWDAQGSLTSPAGPGINDMSGACESPRSPYRSWFHIPATTNAAREGQNLVLCAGETYEGWNAGAHLPKLVTTHPDVRRLFFEGGARSIGPWWISRGAAGWRLDVGADVDGGIRDPGNTFWEGLRAAIQDPALGGRPDAVLIGEEWGDASPWLLGTEWDSVMNYRLRSALLGWLFTSCRGQGCNASGDRFQDEDSHDGSSSGAIYRVTPSELDARLRSIAEDYPFEALAGMMNLAGSHDTNRIRYLLERTSDDDPAEAVQRMKELWLFLFTYAGAPALYYGDEVGIEAGGLWSADKNAIVDDPYNRAPFPWDDTPGDYAADTERVQAFARRMASLRHAYAPLQDGAVVHGVLVDDARGLYAFARQRAGRTALVVLNRSDTTQAVSLPAAGLPDGTALTEALSGRSATVRSGAVALDVGSHWGAILLEPDAIDTPAAPANPARNGDALSWDAVARDTSGGREVAVRYELLRDGTPITVPPPPFGSPSARVTFVDPTPGTTYAVRAVNAAGKPSSDARF